MIAFSVLVTASLAFSAITLYTVIQNLREIIEEDPILFMLFTEMFEQIPLTPEFQLGRAGNPQIRDYMEMLHVMNEVLTQAPEFNKTGLVEFPINTVINWAMGTPAGTIAFS